MHRSGGALKIATCRNKCAVMGIQQAVNGYCHPRLQS